MRVSGVRLAALLAVSLGASMGHGEEVSTVSAPGAASRVARADAVGTVRRSRAYTLARCIALAEKNYPKIAEARARLARMESQLTEAQVSPFSNFELSGGVGLAPTLRGTSIYSPNSDVSLNSALGVGWRVGISGVVPLWTFGKISSVVTAAERQSHVGRAGVEKERNDVRLSVRRAYYGALLARDAYVLVDKAAAIIDKHLRSLERRVEEGDGDDIELIKLKIQRAELDARRSEAGQQERVALAGLRFLTGVTGDLDVVDQPLRKAKHILGPLARYLGAARLHRPEINMARAGVLARQAQVDLERARYLPDLGLGLEGTWARAPLIDDQVNPFVRDQANYLRYGAALVLRWKLDFLANSARVSQAESQLEEQRATERFALGGVGVEVETAFEEAKAAERRLEAYEEATRLAKQWLIKVQQGIDIGTFEDEDVVDPAKEYALKKFALMTATFDYNLAISKLAQATGWADVAPDQ